MRISPKVSPSLEKWLKAASFPVLESKWCHSMEPWMGSGATHSRFDWLLWKPLVYESTLRFKTINTEHFNVVHIHQCKWSQTYLVYFILNWHLLRNTLPFWFCKILFDIAGWQSEAKVHFSLDNAQMGKERNLRLFIRDCTASSFNLSLSQKIFSLETAGLRTAIWCAFAKNKCYILVIVSPLVVA